MFSYGSKLLLSGMINTSFKNIYYLIIGRYYLPADLGQYTRGEQFKNIFSTNLTSVVQRVTFPVLAKIQNDPKRLKNGYKRIAKLSMLITFACMIGLAAVAKPLIIILIGEKWLVAAEYLQIMCFSALLYPMHSLNLNVLQVKGRSDLFLKLEIPKNLVTLIPILIGIVFSIKAMLYARVFFSLISFFINSWYSKQMINYSGREQLFDISLSFVVSLLIGIVMWMMSLCIINVYILLIVQVIVGVVSALSIYEFLKLEEYLELKGIIYSLLKR